MAALVFTPIMQMLISMEAAVTGVTGAVTAMTAVVTPVTGAVVRVGWRIDDAYVHSIHTLRTRHALRMLQASMPYACSMHDDTTSIVC